MKLCTQCALGWHPAPKNARETCACLRHECGCRLKREQKAAA